MILLLLLPLFQSSHGLDASNLVPKSSTDSSPCKSCKVLIESFDKVIHF